MSTNHFPETVVLTDDEGNEYDVLASPAQQQSGFGLGGEAFYQELPLTAVWLDYQEPLAFVPDEWANDRQSWR
jgi:hypothetical protein